MLVACIIKQSHCVEQPGMCINKYTCQTQHNSLDNYTMHPTPVGLNT